MIESIEIKNFRCFEDVTLKNLGRINIIVGQNASGKTALLEAMFLTLAIPPVALTFRLWRGLGDVMQVPSRPGLQVELWRDLFFHFDEERVVSISFSGSSDVVRTLKVSFIEEQTVQVPAANEPIGLNPIRRIKFEWLRDSKVIGNSMPLIKSDGTVEIGQAPETIRGFFISSSSLINAQEAAEVFSSLSKQRQEETVIKAIHELYDYVEDLQVELHGRLPMLYATVRELPEKIPVGLISNGVNKLVTMLAATTKFHHGILIVDEIENGFYFEKMPNIWTLLYKFCKKNGVQLFASTHSQEALNSLLPAMEGHENDFCLLRTKKENGKCTIKHIAGKNLKAAIEQGGEVR